MPPTYPDLSECEREPIHMPGAIQPHGALLAVFAADLRIVQCSANAGDYVGVPADALVGRSLDVLLGPGDLAALRAALAAPADDPAPLHLTAVTPPQWKQPFNVLFHCARELVVVELEPAAYARPGAFHNVHALVRGAVSRLQAVSDTQALCALAAAEVRRLTGFERVMVYRFHEDWHGEVIAEDRAPEVPPFLGLHFPATDIPAQARRLYELNRTRVIPDVSYPPVPLVPAVAPGAAGPTDLSHAVLRSVSPVHIEYLKNMGVAASMSVSILREGKLWGLIACHHRTPRFVAYDLRSACDFIAQILSLQLAAHESGRDVSHRIRLKSAQTQLLRHMAAEEHFVDGLARNSGELIDFVSAGGAALYFGAGCTLLGKTPTEGQVEALVEWLAGRPAATSVEEELFHTDELASVYPPAAEFGTVVAGLLAVSVSRVHRSYVLWFRPEAVQTVTWSGDPHHPAVVGGDRRLHPRRSFEAWKQTVRGRSLPWSDAERDAAAELRQAIVGIVLKKAEEVAALAGALERSNRELESFSYSVSHDLRAPFRHIAGFAELLQKRAGSLDDTSRRYVNTIAESARHAGALVDSLLSFTQIGRAPLKLGRLDMNALVRTVRAELEGEAAGRAVEWVVHPLPAVHADPTMMQTALRNLLGNALKYTRGREAARVEIGARRDEEPPGVVELFVRDNGVGFDMRYAEKLFGVFHRLHRPEEFPGTGIGLANVKRIVERHGGRVWAEAEVDRGATFYFTLPAEQPAQQQA